MRLNIIEIYDESDAMVNTHNDKRIKGFRIKNCLLFHTVLSRTHPWLAEQIKFS